ncbi:hypothetical protein HD554DRAFT_2017845 [Boletus coccyginus]|nr:hypothetical protein HD554DRAFT_2017845 [Boletus coccyginus]
MFPSGIGLDFATLLSTSIECILYGISLVLFGGTVWALTHGRPKDEINWSMALVALIFTIFSTIHVVVDIQRLVVGFISKANIIPGGPTGFFADVTQRTFIIKNAVYILQTLLGDGVAIYRCYVVWQRFVVVMLPAVLWCATSVTSAGLLYHMWHARYLEDVSLPEIGKWIAPFYMLTMTTNVLSSALLAYRIWTTNRDEPGVVRVLSRSGVETTLLLRVLIDAAVLYLLSLFALLVCYAYRSEGEFIVLDMVTHIISIAFYTVLVRIAIARNDSAHVPAATLSPIRFAVGVVPDPPEPRSKGARRSSI